MTLFVEAVGDLGDAPEEFVTVYLNGVLVGSTTLDNGGVDCAYGTATLTMSAAAYNAALAGGNAKFDFIASDLVDDLCAQAWISVRVSYISVGVSSDCNGNGVPDECEPDCNGNGVADECDITSGTSQDCNGNGIPDECDLVSVFWDQSPKLSPLTA